MKNLEWILENCDEETIDDEDICQQIRKCLRLKDCVDENISCIECEFSDNRNLLKALNAEYEERIKLRKVQYEILRCLPKNSLIDIANGELIIHEDNLEMFMNKLGVHLTKKDHHEKQIKIKDILENCDVI